MAESTSQYVHDDQDSRWQPSSSPTTWRPALTTSSLQQLRRGAEDDQQSPTPVSPVMSRRTSFESDRFSAVSGLTSYFPNNPTNVQPAPIYIAPFGASQVVGELLASQRPPLSDDEEADEKLNKDDAQLTPPALALVNAFLDQLLFSFLSTARSTSLLALRPAVTEVLKNRLAKAAIASAEDDLDGLLAGGDDDEEDLEHKTAEDSRRWDLELVWKRTRLRVMVYMRLGEMEDDDEQRYVKEEELFHGNERRFSQSSGLVSWAAAIFLTSVLEYVAEQTLQAAGQAACTRARRESRNQRLAGSATMQKPDALVVEEYDVEKVALHSTLGRLWRTWRKALRNNAATSALTHRSSGSNGRISRDNMTSAMSQHRSSFGTAHEGSVVSESRPMSRDLKEVAEVEYPEHVLAANIPLPMGDAVKDVDEIVVPGLAADPDAEDPDQEDVDEPYPADLLGCLLPLPLIDEKRDVDEIEIPGLARDPDALDAANIASIPPSARRRHSFSEPTFSRELGDSATSGETHLDSLAESGTPSKARLRSMSVPTPARIAVAVDDEAREDSGLETLKPTVYSENAVAQNGSDEPAPPPEPEETQEVALTPKAESPDPARKMEFPWMVGGAATSAVAAAAAGAWALVGSKAQTTQSQRDNDDSMATTENTPSGPVDPTDYTSRDASHDYEGRQEVPDLERDPSHQPFSDKRIEELDRRKSLIDIKSMMIVNGPSNPSSGQGFPEVEEPPSLDTTAGAEHLAVDDAMADGISEEEGPEDAIGVARTSDVPSTVPRMSEEQQTRDVSKRPTRLAIGEVPPAEALDSPTIGQPATPGHLQRQFVDLYPGTDQAPVSQSSPIVKSYSRANLTDGAQQAPAVEGSVGRKTSGSKVSEPKSPKPPKSPRLVSDPTALQALTSASIRAPEDFDSFVQGSETVKYTLTPETVRDETNWTSFQHPQSRQVPIEMDATSTAVQPSRSRAPDQATSTVPSPYTTAGADSEKTSRSEKRRSISKPPTRNVGSHKKTGLVAREPQVLTESTRDFADFIRSTGPKNDTAVHPIMTNASQTSLHSLRSAHIHGAAASRSSSPDGERTRSLSKATAPGLDVPPVPPVPVKSRSSMQPRGGKASATSSSDLIDFIRSGPSEEGTRRISRSVAPFRNTMDSDQLRDFADRSSTERSAEQRLAPSVQSPSMRSSDRTSTNSRSALLNGNSSMNQNVHPAYSGQPQTLSQEYGTSSRNAVAEVNGPSRKRVRNKDPYSMDFLDDDDDDDDLMTSLPDREGQTLAEFLNSTEPPRDNAPLPVVDVNSAQAKAAASRLRAPSSTSQRTANTTRSMPNGSRSRTDYSTPAPSLPPVRRANGTGQKMIARGGAKDIAANSNTQELADFFKASGPDDLDSAPAPTVGRTNRPSIRDDKAARKTERKSGLGGLFSRSTRRKTTYLDMP